MTATDDAGALSVIADLARQQQSPLTVVTELTGSWELSLAGEHQQRNAALALAAKEKVRAASATLAGTRIGPARRLPEKRAYWDGRLQMTQQADGRLIVLDGAHNPAGAEALAAALQARFPGRTPTLILANRMGR